ncbi:hypothetical protein SRHO_G00122560 [Serrasalmus rhombeus]
MKENKSKRGKKTGKCVLRCEKASSTWYSQAVSHPSTNQARSCFRDQTRSGVLRVNLARHSLPEKSEFKEGTSGWGVLLSGLLDHSRFHVFKKPDRRNQDRSS